MVSLTVSVTFCMKQFQVKHHLLFTTIWLTVAIILFIFLHVRAIPFTLLFFLFKSREKEEMAMLDKMFNVLLFTFMSVRGWPKGSSPNSCLLAPASTHLVHSTCNAGTEGGEWCPSLPLKSSVHPPIPSHCPRGSRRAQLNTDLPERAQVQQGVCSSAKFGASVSFWLLRGCCFTLSHFWRDWKSCRCKCLISRAIQQESA